MRKELREDSTLTRTHDTRRLILSYLEYVRDLGEDEILFDESISLDSVRGASDTSREYGTSLDDIADAIRNCRSCPLHSSRRNAVPGDGNTKSGFVFVGEAPGGTEDREGKPFVGASGQLLRRLLQIAGIGESCFYIMNIIKCRPPGNRDPLTEEIEACRPFTEQQLKVLKPKLIVALGRFAGRYLLKRGEDSIRMMRGTLHSVEGIPVIVTYHPSALLHQENFRSHAWEDIVFIRHTADSLGLLTSNGSQKT